MASDDDFYADDEFPEWDSLESAFMDLNRFLSDFHEYADRIEKLMSKVIKDDYERQMTSVRRQIREGSLKLERNEKEEDYLFRTFWEFHGYQIFNESVVLYLFSLFEDAANYICSVIKEKKNIELSRQDLVGGIVPTFKSYLKNIGGFTKPSEEQWLVMEGIYDLRNRFAHGAAATKKMKKRLSHISKLCCPDKLSKYFVTGQFMPSDFYLFAIKSFESFLGELKEESAVVFSGLRKIK